MIPYTYTISDHQQTCVVSNHYLIWQDMECPPVAYVPDREMAEQIARALNSQQVLVEALRELVRAWDATSFPVSERMESALQSADAALQLAGVEQP